MSFRFEYRDLRENICLSRGWWVGGGGGWESGMEMNVTLGKNGSMG